MTILDQTEARRGLDVEDDDPLTDDPASGDEPSNDPDDDDQPGETPAVGDAARGDIPGGAEAAPVLWVVLIPAGIGRPRQARGPFADPTDARAYGRELGGGYEVVEFGFATVPTALPGRMALDALAAQGRRALGVLAASVAQDQGRTTIERAAAAEGTDTSGQPFNTDAFSRT